MATATSFAPAFPTWKTVTLGTHKSGEDLLEALLHNRFKISYSAVGALRQISLAKTKTEIELVLMSVADLGFTEPTRRDAIYDRAEALGLDLVPAEVGPQLRLAMRYQQPNEWLLIAMEPIRSPDRFLRVFALECRHIRTYCCNPQFVWGADSLWVFAQHKHNQSPAARSISIH